MSKFLFYVGSFWARKGRTKNLAFENIFWSAVSISVTLLFLFAVNFPPAKEAAASKSSEKIAQEFNVSALNEENFFSFESDDVKNCSEKKEIEKRKKNLFEVKKQESEFEKTLERIIGEYPIKEMIPYLAKKDKIVVGFVVGIAKKESNWGKRVPTLNGQDCFNYWGYKGAGSRGTSMGYGCFATPEEGAEAISNRIENLVGKGLTTPGKMIVWKCGSTCAGHDPKGVQKWISDVDVYFRKIANI